MSWDIINAELNELGENFLRKRSRGAAGLTAVRSMNVLYDYIERSCHGLDIEDVLPKNRFLVELARLLSKIKIENINDRGELTRTLTHKPTSTESETWRGLAENLQNFYLERAVQLSKSPTPESFVQKNASDNEKLYSLYLKAFCLDRDSSSSIAKQPIESEMINIAPNGWPKIEVDKKALHKITQGLSSKADDLSRIAWSGLSHSPAKVTTIMVNVAGITLKMTSALFIAFMNHIASTLWPLQIVKSLGGAALKTLDYLHDNRAIILQALHAFIGPSFVPIPSVSSIEDIKTRDDRHMMMYIKPVIWQKKVLMKKN
jgi:hypothetical protein